MNSNIYLLLCFVGAIYYPIKYLILSSKYKTIKPSNDYEKEFINLSDEIFKILE